ncbi:hypothetical protein [Amycolatopsis jiangsuensis]|uniref:Uncharacterized protein n=1 Tax=Amycolatopsis jiangsuensis TaxID=1181879 RepID=A0A840IZ32_9PSEU|nr:hypothetical protein [Amycolatopsis jiangsuensis]MBB4687080.1 hypothetical protein [Amycolatopsis jiangsuensis]
MTGSEDELEQRLRALFADDRLAVEPADDAASAIAAGARKRRRRRRTLTTAAGVVCVLTIGAGVVAFQLRAPDNGVAVSAQPITDSRVPAVPPSAESPSSTSDVPEPPPAVTPPSEETHSSRQPSGTRKSKSPSGRATAQATSGALVTADGLAGVKLGMSEQQLTDNGVTLLPVKESPGCRYFALAGPGIPRSTAVVSPDNGVVAVKPVGAAHTPEGVGDGSTKDEVAATYPGTSETAGALVSPTGDQGTYRFSLSPDGAVASIEVRTATQDCLT